jgi:penicillin-binding protein 1C
VTRQKRLFILVITVLCAMAAATVIVVAAAMLIPLPMDKLSIPPSTCIYDCDGGLMYAFLAPDDRWRIKVSYEDVSEEFLQILVAYEDRFFWQHFGVNPFALGRAVIQNARAREVVSGGSTLTMQVARLLDPKPRTVLSKLRELLQAIGLELRYSKEEILGMYLNLAPYGGNIEGIGAAALLYFGKSPQELSTAEAALLVALPRSPEALRPDRHSEAARQARDEVLRRAVLFGAIDESLARSALSESVPSSRRSLPRTAPHLSRFLSRRYGPGNIYSTISPHIQSEVEKLLSQHVSSLRVDGISNGSVVVIDNITHSIVAYVGSADFYDDEASGQVDGVRSPRSPGSTLKPFIYAVAMDKGLITPKMYLEDVPVSYGSYSPQNYSHTFSGIASAESALLQSLNIPAVNLLNSIGVDTLYDFLRRAGVTSLSAVHNYGLSMAIGGCDVTLIELTTLYSILANGGTLYPPSLVRPTHGTDNPLSPSRSLLSPASAYLISLILSSGTRPDLPSDWQSTSLPRVAWKTGTSYGHRDSWSIGFTSRYTVGVWLGNFSGEGSGRLVGAEVASPLLFRIIGRLSKGSEPEWLKPPASIEKRVVCSLSGMPAGPYCTDTTQDYYIKGKSPDRQCSLHKVALVDETTGMRVPDYLRGTEGIVEQTYIDWPPAVVAWRTAALDQGQQLPPLDPRYATKVAGGPPRITSPASTLIIQQGSAATPVTLVAEAGVGSLQLYWFIDGEFVRTSRPGEAASYSLSPGTHELVCTDELGRAATMTISVSPPE